MVKGGRKLTWDWYFQIYTSLRPRFGIPDHCDDGFSCNTGDQKVHAAADITLLDECYMKLIIVSSIFGECFLPIFDPSQLNLT